MSVNRHLPHLYVLPEDDANRQLANGFHLGMSQQRQMQVLPIANGWIKVLDEFEAVHISEMRRSSYRSMVLLIDFDGEPGRLAVAKARIPNDLADRVFVLGVLSEPEDLRSGSLESVGEQLAHDCRDGTRKAWNHDLLQHNAAEVDRLRQLVRPFLFT